MNPTYVLVHGAFCNSFSWAPLQRELALRGQRSLAVDLPGHGFGAKLPVAYQAPQDPAGLASAPSAMAGVTLADNVEHVTGIVRRAAEHGPVILVGHSRGGLTLTSVGNAIPDLIDRVVYVSAWCCVNLTAAEYTETPEHGTNPLTAVDLIAANPAELGALRVNFRAAGPAELPALKAALFADGTDDEFLTALNLLEPDENLDTGGADDRARAADWGRIPRTYVRLTQDMGVPLALQDRFIAEADALTPDNPFHVRTLDCSHLKVLVHPADLADILVEPVG